MDFYHLTIASKSPDSFTRMWSTGDVLFNTITGSSYYSIPDPPQVVDHWGDSYIVFDRDGNPIRSATIR